MKVSKQVPDGILRPALCPRIGELRFLWVIVPRRLGRTRGYRGRALQVAHPLCPGLKLLPLPYGVHCRQLQEEDKERAHDTGAPAFPHQGKSRLECCRASNERKTHGVTLFSIGAICKPLVLLRLHRNLMKSIGFIVCCI